MKRKLQENIVHGSKIAIRSQIDYFGELQPTDVSISNSTVENVLSYFPIEQDNDLEFHIQSSVSQLTDLRNSSLYVQCKIVKNDDSKLTSSDDVSCVNLLLHSLIKSVEIIVNGTSLYHSGNTYPLRAYIQTQLGFGVNRKKFDLTSALYFGDTDKVYGSCEGAKARKTYLTESKIIELESPLLTDLTNQPKYIPNNCEIIIRLTRSSPQFVLWAPKSTTKTSTTTTTTTSSTCPFKIIFTQCKLKVLRHTLNDPFLKNIQSSLESGKVGRIPVKTTQVKLYYVPSNVYSVLTEGIFVGRIPEKVVVCLIPTEILLGNVESNQYWFEHNNLSSVTLTTDTENGITSHNLNIDGDAGITLEAYRSLLNLIPSLETSNGLARSDFLKGNCFFSFELQPRGLLETMQKATTGSVRLGLTFKSQVVKPLTVVLYCQYDQVITFDKDRDFQIE